MTVKDIINNHHKKCEDCDLKDNCEGVHVTINGTSKCERGELKNDIGSNAI